MRLSDAERQDRRAAFARMGMAERVDYVLAYYKLPIVCLLIALTCLGFAALSHATHREPTLYVAYANLVPPPKVDERLTVGYLSERGIDPASHEVVCYHELYLTDAAATSDHQYAYASRLKLMAAIEDASLDVLIMNQEARDLLSAAGYLADLTDSFAGNERLTEGTVVISDNRTSYELGEDSEYVAETQRVANSLEVTDSSLLSGFSGDERVFAGIVANTERLREAEAYLAYLAR